MLSSMKHPVSVRPLTDAERGQLVAGLRSSDAFVHRRSQILLASARGEPTPHVATVWNPLEAGQTREHEPGPGVCPEKRARDRLMRLVATHPTWALGFEDEVWWSRLAQPALHSWAEPGQPLRLVEQAVAQDDPDPKALACYG